MSPHVERRLQAPIKQYARKSMDWRGVSSVKLAEQYANQRLADETLAAAIARVNRTANSPSQLGNTLSWQQWVPNVIRKLMQNIAADMEPTSRTSRFRSFRQRSMRLKERIEL